jgi:hypothetical protein
MKQQGTVDFACVEHRRQEQTLQRGYILQRDRRVDDNGRFTLIHGFLLYGNGKARAMSTGPVVGVDVLGKMR